MQRPFRHLLLSLAVAGTALAATALPVSATTATTVDLDQGHTDVGVAYEDGAFNLHVHDGVNEVEYAPSEVRLVAKSAARTSVPDDPAFAFLGDPGDPVWILPEVQDPDLLWLGLGSEEIEPGVFAGDTVNLDVVRVYGPADLSVFTTDPAGTPNVLADSGDGLPDRLALVAGSHAHVTWAFEAAGTYAVVVRASGTLSSTGEMVTSGLATYRFKVQP
jgi:surface-anchored protein